MFLATEHVWRVMLQVLRSPLLPVVDEDKQQPATFESTLWGPTCDSADYVYKDVQLPELRNGDWLMFANSGAYTVAGACDFNGIAMTQPNKFFIFSAQAVDDLEESDEADGAEDEASELGYDDDDDDDDDDDNCNDDHDDGDDDGTCAAHDVKPDDDGLKDDGKVIDPCAV
jgi:hypothetical protein